MLHFRWIDWWIFVKRLAKINLLWMWGKMTRRVYSSHVFLIHDALQVVVKRMINGWLLWINGKQWQIWKWIKVGWYRMKKKKEMNTERIFIKLDTLDMLSKYCR
jgi:hypothetical protein